ncbi:MAG: hypothetical protein LR001_03590 [Clostridiales bacterium]|nr:hypothetical protein [Clostridiales bacterium]
MNKNVPREYFVDMLVDNKHILEESIYFIDLINKKTLENGLYRGFEVVDFAADNDNIYFELIVYYQTKNTFFTILI